MSDLLVEHVDRVLVLTLNRPEKHNAISVQLAEDIATTIEEADEEIRAVVIRGAGKSFSAGYDIVGGSYGTREIGGDARHLRRLTQRWDRVLHAPLPVIAQVHGYCLAGGTDLAGHCDLVVVADDAVIGFPAVRSMGVAPTQMWIYHVGPQWAKRLLLTGDTMTGSLAAEIGFALRSVPRAELEAEVMTLARRISLVEREMLIGNKYVINQGLELMGRSQLQDIAAAQDAIAHQAAPAKAFAAQVRSEGLRAALQGRDGPFAPDDPIEGP